MTLLLRCPRQILWLPHAAPRSIIHRVIVVRLSVPRTPTAPLSPVPASHLLSADSDATPPNSLDFNGNIVYAARQVTSCDTQVLSKLEARESRLRNPSLPYPLTKSTVLRCVGNAIFVTYTNEEISIDRWLADNVPRNTSRTWGLDCEWACFKNIGVKSPPVDVIQIASESRVLIAQVCHLFSRASDSSRRHIPLSIERLCNDDNNVVSGVGVGEDLNKVRASGKNDGCARVLELSGLVRAIGCQKTSGLQNIAKLFLGLPVWKRKRETLSNWQAHHLSEAQVRYAAMDAWASRQLVEPLMLAKSIHGESSFTSWASDHEYLLAHDTNLLPRLRPERQEKLARAEAEHWRESHGIRTLAKSKILATTELFSSAASEAPLDDLDYHDEGRHGLRQLIEM